ncbi:MAG: Stp1/IreP family PP2C-type Ser/Thr phosphatase [Ktedonobacteraceae bacterium]
MLTQKQPSSWVVRAKGVTHIGRIRQNNEDNLFVDEKRGLFIVSDGMGGHQAGEVASNAVVTVLPPMIEQLAARVETPSKEAFEQVLRDAILELSQRLRDESKGQAGLQGMGATVVVVWLQGQRAHMAYMGDSRIYLFRAKQLTQLTQDHSVIALLLHHKEITEEEAKHHPARGQLSRYVGMEGDTFSDLRTVSLFPDDRLLLCSDGLTGMVSPGDIHHVLASCPDPGAACNELVDMANKAGGKDNITALVINFDKQQSMPAQPMTSVPQHMQEKPETPEQQRPSEKPETPEQQKVPEQPRVPEQRRVSPPRRPRPQKIVLWQGKVIHEAPKTQKRPKTDGRQQKP